MRGIRIVETRRARDLRESQARAEGLLWRALRGRALGGFKFVRQEPIGPYFADFVARSEKLVVEIDGATHSTDEELQRDRRRTEDLRSHGFEVIRFTNDDVYRNMDGVLAMILARFEGQKAVSERPPRKAGRAKGEGEAD
jgi:very-short-patch-repair endonuclease